MSVTMLDTQISLSCFPASLLASFWIFLPISDPFIVIVFDALFFRNSLRRQAGFHVVGENTSICGVDSQSWIHLKTVELRLLVVEQVKIWNCTYRFVAKPLSIFLVGILLRRSENGVSTCGRSKPNVCRVFCVLFISTALDFWLFH